MDKELANVLLWLGNTIDVYDICLGEYEAMFDERAQYQEWKCLGCSGTGFAKWPEWKVSFAHTPDCTYQKLRRMIEEAEATAQAA